VLVGEEALGAFAGDFIGWQSACFLGMDMMDRRMFLRAAGVGAASVAFADGLERIRVGQMGSQHAHAAGKLEAVRRLAKDFEVVGIAGADERLGAAYDGVARVSEQALLDDRSVKMILVETRIEDATAAALRAVRAGKHVHLDKPGGLDHATFAAMRREAEGAGLTVQMGYMLRHNPAFDMLFQGVREGWFGEILEIDAMMGKLADPRTRTTIGALEGGGMFELACHVIDAAMTLLGKPSEVHAFSTPTQGDGVKDHQLAVLVYPKATATIRCNHADPNGGPRRRFQVAGTKGAMEILPLESGKATLWLDEARGPWKKGMQSVTFPLGKGRYDGEFVELARVIRSGGRERLRWDAAHDVAVHETVLRAAGIWKGDRA
jgi:predicted dehydrogenase